MREFWLEVGFGNGEHLLWQASRNPEVGFLGVEFFENGLAALCTDLSRLPRDANYGLGNIRVYRGDVRTFLDRLEDRSLHRVISLFPDPWPKKRHVHRRWLQASTLRRLGGLLVPQGEILLASDSRTFQEWIPTRFLEVQDLFRGPDISHGVLSEEVPPTRYQKKAHEAGRESLFFLYRRR